MESAVTHLIGTSRLRELLEIRSWYSFNLLRHRGVIPQTPPFVNGDRELWPVSDIPKIQERINTYHRTKSEAEHNALSTV
jgi:hypothetical protein